MPSCSVVGSCVKTSAYTAAGKLLYNIQNFASIDSSVWFLYARCIILLLWIPLNDFLWSVPWSPLKAIKLLLFSPLYDVHNFASVDFQNYIFFHILSRVIFVSVFMMESQISRIPVYVWPYKNEIGIMVLRVVVWITFYQSLIFSLFWME
jgi:hypothetical protein